MITISNCGETRVGLGGCIISDEGGKNKYILPDSVSVEKNLYFFCSSNGLKTTTIPEPYLVWLNKNGSMRKKNVLNDSGDQISLLDPSGNLIASCHKNAAGEKTLTPGRVKESADTVEFVLENTSPSSSKSNKRKISSSPPESHSSTVPMDDVNDKEDDGSKEATSAVHRTKRSRNEVASSSMGDDPHPSSVANETIVKNSETMEIESSGLANVEKNMNVTESTGTASSTTSGTMSKKSGTSRSSRHQPTVREVTEDRLTALASEHWAKSSSADRKYDEQLVKDIYRSELQDCCQVPRVLDISGYLERYLWNFFDAAVCSEHIFSIVIMMNEKFKEDGGAGTLDEISRSDSNGAKFSVFFGRMVSLVIDDEEHLHAEDPFMVSYILFLVNCFRSLENDVLRSCLLSFVSLPMFESLSRSKLQETVEASPALARHWKMHKEKQEHGEPTARWMPILLNNFLKTVECQHPLHITRTCTLYLERFAEFTIDLLSQVCSSVLPTFALYFSLSNYK